MTSFRRFLVLSTLMTIAGLGTAQANAVGAGSYSLAIGASAPCDVTLAADGSASFASTCKADSSSYSHWVRTPTGVQFQDTAGNVGAILKAKGEGYAGLSIVNNRNLVLTPATQTAAH